MNSQTATMREKLNRGKLPLLPPADLQQIGNSH